jgi:cytochrome P450
MAQFSPVDLGWLFWYFVLLGSAVIAFLVFDVWRKTYSRLPPGLSGWPLLGNLLQVGNKPNESFFQLACKFGPLMTLSLGMKTTVVVSSSAMAREVLKTHDHICSGRIVTQASKALSQYKTSMVFSQYGSHWRMLRRVSNTELFSVKRLEALQHLRRDQVNRMIHQIFQDAVKGKCVDIGHTAFQSSFNLLGKMIFGKDVFDLQFDRGSRELKDVFSKLAVLHATPNLADFFPCLQFLDLQGVYRSTEIYTQKLYDVIDKFIEDRLGTRSRENSERNYSEKDLLDVLLEMRSHEFTLSHITAYINDLFGAGAQTTANTIEWAMAELIHNPEKMKRVQAELEEIVGQERKVEESVAERLPYLHAVVKEVLRLHPPVPFLIPHRADNRCEIAGFVIPKHTQILVNVWAIGRDPSIWKEPLKFIPERFIDDEMSSVDYRGQNLELIPFGAGRRMCVGLPLASRMVHLLLASLLHSFEWALPEGMSAHQVDMSDRFGITLAKAVPLEAIPTPRLPSELYCY